MENLGNLAGWVLRMEDGGRIVVSIISGIAPLHNNRGYIIL